MTDLSIIIPTHRRNDMLKALLLALEAQALRPSDYEVIVAVDGHSTETVALLRSVQPAYHLHWLTGPRRGPGMARNRGAEAANGRLLLFLDDDMLPAPGLLAAHLDAHNGQSKRLILGQVRLWPRQRLTAWERYLSAPFEVHYDKMGQRTHQPSFWDCLSGNLSLTRALFLASRGFNPIFGCGKHEDIELGYRLEGMGAQLHYLPQALSYHRYNKSLAAGLRDSLRNGVSALYFVRRFPELFPQLLLARWQRYPRPLRALLASVLPLPTQRDRLARWVAGALERVEHSPLPGRWRRPVHRLAYHLHFWHGLAEAADTRELRILLLKLSGRTG